jgi:XTP/dITP diphosphohydrolase
MIAAPFKRILAATGNPHKLEEIRQILAGTGIEVVSPAEVGWSAEVEEDGATLEANALKKARAGTAAGGIATMADDTGLFVDALDGAPGVLSARYAGPEEDPAANCAKLLAALDGMPRDRRGAAFRCVIALVSPGGPERVFEGSVRGHITTEKRGTAGFGYDPLFEAEDTGRTFAEMSAEEKHGLSHRGRALAALRGYLAGTAEKERS